MMMVNTPCHRAATEVYTNNQKDTSIVQDVGPCSLRRRAGVLFHGRFNLANTVH